MPAYFKMSDFATMRYMTLSKKIDILFDAIKKGETYILAKTLSSLRHRELNRILRWRPVEYGCQNLNILSYACKKGSIEIVDKLLEIHRVWDKVAYRDNQAFRLAAGHGHTAVTLRLLQISAVRQNVTAQRCAALYFAVRFGHANVVRELLKLAEFENELINDARSNNYLLLKAAKFGHIEIVKILLANKEVRENVTVRNNEAFRVAVLNSHVLIVRELLKQNVVREQAAVLNNYALYHAATKGYVDIVRELLKIETVKNHLTAKNSIILATAKRGQIEVLKFLLNVPDLFTDLISYSGQELRSVMAAIRNRGNEAQSKAFFELLTIYGISLDKVIDFNSASYLNDMKSFCAAPESFFEKRGLPAQQAVRILHSEQRVLEYEQQIKRLEKTNTPDDPKIVQATISYFNSKIKPAFSQKFIERGQILGIEASIRENLLNRMLKTAHEQKALFQEKLLFMKLDHQCKVIEFIENNVADLIHGQNEELMSQARKYFNLNTDNDHVAWRAFDKWAPCDPNWPNLLTEQLIVKDEVYSIKEVFAGEMIDGKVSSQMASNIVRELICYSYLLATDESAGEIHDRVANFFGQIKDCRRAHNAGMNDVDSPSCLPGVIGRVYTMWAMHPLTPKGSFIEELPGILKAKVVSTFIECIKRDSSESEKLYQALIMLCKATAQDVLNNRIEIDPDLAQIRQIFTDELGTFDEWVTYVNSSLTEMNIEHSITQDESIYILNYLADIGGAWICDALTSAYLSNTTLSQDVNPYLLEEGDKEMFSPEMLANIFQQSAAWSYINPIVREYFGNQEISHLVHALVRDWTKSIQQKRTFLFSDETQTLFTEFNESDVIKTKINQAFIERSVVSGDLLPVPLLNTNVTPMFQNLRASNKDLNQFETVYPNKSDCEEPDDRQSKNANRYG